MPPFLMRLLDDHVSHPKSTFKPTNVVQGWMNQRMHDEQKWVSFLKFRFISERIASLHQINALMLIANGRSQHHYENTAAKPEAQSGSRGLQTGCFLWQWTNFLQPGESTKLCKVLTRRAHWPFLFLVHRKNAPRLPREALYINGICECPVRSLYSVEINLHNPLSQKNWTRIKWPTWSFRVTVVVRFCGNVHELTWELRLGQLFNWPRSVREGNKKMWKCFPGLLYEKQKLV